MAFDPVRSVLLGKGGGRVNQSRYGPYLPTTGIGSLQRTIGENPVNRDRFELNFQGAPDPADPNDLMQWVDYMESLHKLYPFDEGSPGGLRQPGLLNKDVGVETRVKPTIDLGLTKPGRGSLGINVSLGDQIQNILAGRTKGLDEAPKFGSPFDLTRPPDWRTHLVHGLVTGERQEDPWGEKRMGSGHPEKEFPSQVPGFTVQRIARGEPTISMSGYPSTYHPEQRGRSGRGGATGRYAERTTNRNVDVAYNWVKNDTGEIVAHLNTRMNPQGDTYVRLAAVKPEYQRGPVAKALGTNRFILDIYNIVAGAGRPVKADLANMKLAEKLGRKGATDPMFEYFHRMYGTRAGEERRVTPFGQAQAVSQHRDDDEDPYEPDEGPEYFDDEPEPWVPESRAQWGSNIAAGHYSLPTGTEPIERVLARIEARLDRDNHHDLVDEIHDANSMSPYDRAQLYLNHMEASSDYSAQTVSAYRRSIAGTGRPLPPAPTTTGGAAERFAQRLRQDGWNAEVLNIRGQTTTAEHRLADYLQFMRQHGYHPLTVQMYEQLIPEADRERIMRLASHSPTTGLGPRDTSRRVDIAVELFGHVARVNPRDAQEISNTWPENADTRIRAYLDFMRSRPTQFTPRMIQGYENRLPDLFPQTPRSTRPNMDNRNDVAHELAGILRGQYPHEVSRIGMRHPNAVGSRIRAYLDLMRGQAGYSEQTIRMFEDRLPDMFPPNRRVLSANEVEAQHAARAHLAEQRSHAAGQARQRQIEEEMDRIGYNPTSEADQRRYDELSREWDSIVYPPDQIESPVSPQMSEPEPRSQGQFSEQIGPSGERLAPPGAASWENAYAHLRRRLAEDGHQIFIDEVQRRHPGVSLEARQNRVNDYMHLMNQFYQPETIESYQRLIPEPVRRAGLSTPSGPPTPRRTPEHPGEVSWPNAAFHAYNQLVRDGLFNVAQRATIGMNEAQDRFNQYMRIMQDHHYTSVITDSFWALSPTPLGDQIRQQRTTWPQG